MSFAIFKIFYMKSFIYDHVYKRHFVSFIIVSQKKIMIIINSMIFSRIFMLFGLNFKSLLCASFKVIALLEKNHDFKVFTVTSVLHSEIGPVII